MGAWLVLPHEAGRGLHWGIGLSLSVCHRVTSDADMVSFGGKFEDGRQRLAFATSVAGPLCLQDRPYKRTFQIGSDVPGADVAI